MNTNSLMLIAILALLILNTSVLRHKSRILSEVPSKILQYTLVAVLITDVISSKDVVINNLEIAILLLMFMTVELLLLIFQRFAGERQIKSIEAVLDFNKSIKQKFQDKPVFMLTYAVFLIIVIVAFWLL